MWWSTWTTLWFPTNPGGAQGTLNTSLQGTMGESIIFEEIQVPVFEKAEAQLLGHWLVQCNICMEFKKVKMIK